MIRRNNTALALHNPSVAQKTSTKNRNLPFKRIITTSESTKSIKKHRKGEKLWLPPCVYARKSQRQLNSQMDYCGQFERICNTGRFQFITEQSQQEQKLQDQKTISSTNEMLAQTKNAYNNMMNETNRLTQNIALLRNELRDKTDGMRFGKNCLDGMHQLERKYQQRFNELKDKQQDVLNQYKILKYIIQRMSSDRIIYDKRISDLEETAVEQKRNLAKELETQLETVNRQCLYRNSYKKTRRNIQKGIEFITDKIHKFEKSVEKRLNTNRQSEPIISLNSDKSHLDLLMVHLLLDKMLKAKTAELQERFQKTEKCFEIIKQSTMFQQQNLVNKFLTQNQTFEMIKQTIDSYEERLRKAAKRNTQLLLVYQNNKFQPDNYKLSDTTRSSSRTSSRAGKTVTADPAVYRMHNIVNWVAINLNKLNSIKHQTSLSVNEFKKQLDFKQIKDKIKSCQTHSEIGVTSDEFIVHQVCNKFKELSIKITSKLHDRQTTQKGEVKRKKFRTDGIFIKKYPIRLTLEEEREQIAERQNVQQVVRMQNEWINQSRLQTKRSRR